MATPALRNVGKCEMNDREFIMGHTGSGMKPTRVRLRLAATVAMGTCLAVSPLHADGVAVLKEQPFHRDLSAHPVFYQRIIDSRGPWLRIVTHRGNLDIGRSKLAAWIEVPGPLPDSVVDGSDLAWFRETLGLMERFAARYPRSAALLEPEIVSLRAQLARFDAGEIRVNGEWMTRRQLQQRTETRAALAKAERRKEIERLVSDKAMEDQGWVRSNGAWVPSAGAEARPLAARTPLSDCLWPLHHPDARAAKLALENLTALAQSDAGASKVTIERLTATIRNVFRAEHSLSLCMLSNAAMTAEAARHERHSQQWSKPNAFGTPRDAEATTSFSKAALLRNDAANQLAEHREALRAQLDELDLLTADLFQQGEHRAALTLGETVRAIAGRRFPDGDYEPTFPPDSLESIRAEIQANGPSGSPQPDAS